MIYIFEHELSHVLNGHVHYLDKELGVSCMIEDAVSYDALLSQTLEYDADCTAMNRCVMTLLSWANNPDRVDEKWRPFVLCKYRLLFYLAFAVRSLFLIWILKHVGIAELNSSSHPTPQMRSIWCHAVILEFVKQKYPLMDLNKVADSVIEGSVYAFQCYSKTVHNPLNPYLKKDGAICVSSKDEDYRVWQIGECWSDIRDDLEKVAYQNLAPKT